MSAGRVESAGASGGSISGKMMTPSPCPDAGTLLQGDITLHGHRLSSLYRTLIIPPSG